MKYQGRINCRKLMGFLDTVLLAEGFTQISSEITTDGYVYKSPGADEEVYYVRLRDPKTSYLQVGIYQKYTPNATSGLPGAFENGYENDCLRWNYNTYADRMDVDYIIHTNKKRLIIYISGQKAEAWTMSSLAYIGVPKVIDANDKTGKFAGILTTTGAGYSAADRFYALENRAGTKLSSYYLDYYTPRRSIGWGNHLFFSPIFVGSRGEGTRGILDGIYAVEKVDGNTEVNVGDTFTHNGVNYMLVSLTATGYQTLSTNVDYLIEI